jgi:hypothetical protein
MYSDNRGTWGWRLVARREGTEHGEHDVKRAGWRWCQTHGRSPHAPATVSAATFRAFSISGYKGDISQVRAGHALTTLGKHIDPS